MLRNFINDESGAVTVDYVVFLGGVATMALTIVSDIAQATMTITDRINERTSYESIIAEIEQSYSTAGSVEAADGGGGSSGNSGSDDAGSQDSDPGSGDSNGSGSDGKGYGNPGNDKNVGKAGENPNGKGGWGNGKKGRSE
jgi:Flp pilus assembly pilin Flp